jgi:hypothetical protein
MPILLLKGRHSQPFGTGYVTRMGLRELDSSLKARCADRTKIGAGQIQRVQPKLWARIRASTGRGEE